MKGATVEEIARSAGVRPGTVKGVLCRLGCDFDRWEIPRDAMFFYCKQKGSAKARGIRWEFTPTEWWAVWSGSGKWPLRGKGRGCYVMARHGDTGPYATWNVRITTQLENMREAGKLRRLRNASSPPCASLVTPPSGGGALPCESGATSLVVG